jgi:hypothetical protein
MRDDVEKALEEFSEYVKSLDFSEAMKDGADSEEEVQEDLVDRARSGLEDMTGSEKIEILGISTDADVDTWDTVFVRFKATTDILSTADLSWITQSGGEIRSVDLNKRIFVVSF